MDTIYTQRFVFKMTDADRKQLAEIAKSRQEPIAATLRWLIRDAGAKFGDGEILKNSQSQK